MPIVGDILADRYRLESVLGVGGMASVYRATDLRLDRQVAVKVLAADLAPLDDVQATGAAKRHLAGVLLRRVARQLMEARS